MIKIIEPTEHKERQGRKNPLLDIYSKSATIKGPDMPGRRQAKHERDANSDVTTRHRANQRMAITRKRMAEIERISIGEDRSDHDPIMIPPLSNRHSWAECARHISA